MPRVWINERAYRELEKGSLHVFAQNIERVEAENGDWVEVLYGNETVGYGFYSSRSSIPVKIFAWEEAEPEELVLSRMETLFQRKGRLNWDAYRLVFAEADLLPGLIVDIFGDVASLRITVYGLERFKESIADFLTDRVGNVVERNDVRARELEGLPRRKGLLRGDRATAEIREGNALFFVDVLKGQKTGFYLDQRENREFVEPYGDGRVLDVFAYTGGFGIHLGLGGAHVTFVEIGKEEVAMLRRNLELNGVEGEIIRGDVIPALKKLLNSGQRFDVVVLDPPALAHERSEAAKRMYFLLNRLAVRLLKPGGYLFTSSCSQPITPKEFLGIVVGALRKEGRRAQALGSLRGPSRDHTYYPPHPETLYLKFLPLVVE